MPELCVLMNGELSYLFVSCFIVHKDGHLPFDEDARLVVLIHHGQA